MQAIHKLEITGLTYGGRGVARLDGRVVFVPFSAPGDVVLVRLTGERKNYLTGEIVSIERPSEAMVEPRCPVFGTCGGCSLQHIRYTEEVRWKGVIFRETLRRIGGMGEMEFEEPAPSPLEYGWRRRARFQVSGRRWGFFRRGSHDVVDIDSCPLLDVRLNEAFRKVKEILRDRFKNLCSRVGLFEAAGAVGDDGGVVFSLLLKRPVRSFPCEEIIGGAGIRGLEVKLARRRRVLFSAGETTVTCGGPCACTVPAVVFSQVNSEANRILVRKVIEYANPCSTDTVVELFSGAGNFTFPLAERAGRVTAVEVSAAAVKAAGRGASARGLENIEFITAPADRWLTERAEELEKAPSAVVVLDPPRGGDRPTVEALVRTGPERVVYISCDPPAMARDLAILARGGLRPVRGATIDLFPRTYHFEGIVLMEREHL